MKQFENKTTTIKIKTDEELIEAKYSDLIRLALKTPNQEGLSFDDIEHRVRISTALTNIKGNVISLEDADYKYLVNLTKRTRWNFWHEDLLKFRDDILCQ